MPEAPSKPGRGRPPKMSKEDVLDVAMNAYWEDGPTAVSLNSICQRAVVSKPSVYNAFGSEDGLTCAALEHYGQFVMVKMLEILHSKDRFPNIIKRVAHLAAQDAQHQKGCLFVKMRSEKSQMGEKTQTLIAHLESMSRDAFATVLAEGKANGEWAGNIPVELAAHYLHAQIGLALDQRARGEDPTEVLAMALSVFEFTET